MILKDEQQFKSLVNILNKRTKKKHKQTNYYITNKQQFKELLEIIENENDKTFFTNLYFIYEKYFFDTKLIISIVKITKLYIKLFIKKQYLTKKDIQTYNKYLKVLNKKLINKKNKINTYNKHFKNNSITKKYNIINFFNDPDFKINNIQNKDDKLNKQINKYKKVEKDTIKKLGKVDKLKGKLLDLLEQNKNI